MSKLIRTFVKKITYTPCYVLVFKKFNKIKKNNYGTTNFNRILFR